MAKNRTTKTETNRPVEMVTLEVAKPLQTKENLDVIAHRLRNEIENSTTKTIPLDKAVEILKSLEKHL
jgi:hypothetical protein